jgi:hypothetical protein
MVQSIPRSVSLSPAVIFPRLSRNGISAQGILCLAGRHCHKPNGNFLESPRWAATEDNG